MSQVLTMSLVFLLFAVFLQVLSVSIPYWLSTPAGNIGLWQICTTEKCISNVGGAEHAKIKHIIESISHHKSGFVGYLAGRSRSGSHRSSRSISRRRRIRQHGHGSTNVDWFKDYFKALKGLQVLGLLFGVSSIVVFLIGKLTNILDPRSARRTSATLTFLTGVIILIGIIEFCVKGLQLSACFAMSLVSAFCCGIIGGRLTVSEEH